MALRYADFKQQLKDMGDPLADEVVTQLLDAGQVNTVNDVFRQISTAGSDIPAGAPPVLRDYMESTRQFPSWVTPGELARTAAFFQRYQGEAATLQATAGLVGTYLSPMGAKTLDSTHVLRQPHRRLSQSTRLFVGMGNEDAFTSHSKLVPTCQKVRLIHAAIRQLHLRSGQWDQARDGMPVSQLYTAGAALVFSVGILDAMDNLGFKVAPADAEGFYFAWRIVAHFLGVPDGILPEGYPAGRELWHEARPHEWASSPEGINLTRECIELYQRYVGVPGAVAAFLRLALGNTYADMMKIPKNAVLDPVAQIGGLFNKVLAATPLYETPPVKKVLGELSNAVQEISIEAFTHGQETEPQMADRIVSA
ncbi:oxygenase MpaB family protein [Nonomuraea sp. GTA35]|uniref:oxygenase MpaB family protein n=1 Tax=Nonomuraea sp. GTA35 TaxID=1676746 RepID=UPI0035C153AC